MSKLKLVSSVVVVLFITGMIVQANQIVTDRFPGDIIHQGLCSLGAGKLFASGDGKLCPKEFPRGKHPWCVECIKNNEGNWFWKLENHDLENCMTCKEGEKSKQEPNQKHECIRCSDDEWIEKEKPEGVRDDCVGCVNEEWKGIEPYTMDDEEVRDKLEPELKKLQRKAKNAENCQWTDAESWAMNNWESGGWDEDGPKNEYPKEDAYENPYCEYRGVIVQDTEGNVEVVSSEEGGNVVEQDFSDHDKHYDEKSPPKASPSGSIDEKISQDETVIGSYHTHPWSPGPSYPYDYDAAKEKGIPGMVIGPEGDFHPYGPRHNASTGACNKDLLQMEDEHQ